ncbi:hypothetical protein BVER_05806 [Candidatus Burkholderia verschuerenii]|uniref:Transposase n=1 Tax=Candidatus Burkholderia verschuerenii TaxID=242163 RepID=A0A0L0M5C9_9BURK|nr:hypothetical protein BVER_05806 [Candidatus Burkholderia verschuerenii]
MSTPDFFRSRLDSMIDQRHPLAVLANRMPWASIEATLVPVFERLAREGRSSEALDLFGVAPKLAGAGMSAAGRPRLPIRLMVGLLYLKHAYNESDESVVGPSELVEVKGGKGPPEDRVSQNSQKQY